MFGCVGDERVFEMAVWADWVPYVLLLLLLYLLYFVMCWDRMAERLPVCVRWMSVGDGCVG